MALVAAVAAAGIWYANGLVTYFVMPDELGYVKQAGHIARTGFINVPGDIFFGSYGQLEPLLISPGYALFGAPTAFDVAHAINAVAFASAAVPVYLLARRIYESRPACFLTAALAVVVPWLAMSGTVLTEPAAYPAFCWALFGMQNALERRTYRADVLALAGLALVFFARTQFLVLVPAFVIALVVHRAWDREGGSRAIGREHAVLLGVLGLVLVVVATDRGALLSNYSVTTNGSLFPPGWVSASRELTAYVAVALGVVPLGLGSAWAVMTLGRPAGRPQHAFAALSLAVGVTLVVLAGTYTVRFSPAINDRYLVYLVPILAVGTIALLLDPRRRMATAAVVIGGLAAAVLVGASDLTEAGPSLISPSAAWHTVLNGRTQQVARALGLSSLSPPTAIAIVAGVAAMAIAILQLRFARPVVTAIVGIGLLAYGTVETGYTLHSVRITQAAASPGFAAGRDWVDQLVGRRSNVAAFLGPAGDLRSSAVQWWDTTFFNESVSRVYAQDYVIYDQSYARAFTVDPRTGIAAGLPDERLALTALEDRRVGWRGARVLAVHGGIQLVRLATPLTAQWTASASDPAGTTPPTRPTTIHLYGDGTAATREVAVAATVAPAATTPAAFLVTSGHRTYRALAPAGGAPRTIRLRVRLPARGSAQLKLRATRSAPVVLAGVSLKT